MLTLDFHKFVLITIFHENIQTLKSNFLPSDFVGSIPDRAAGKPPEPSNNQTVHSPTVPDEIVSYFFVILN